MSRFAPLILLFVVVACNRPTLQEEVLDDSTFETTDGTEHHWLEEQKKENELEERQDPPSDKPQGKLDSKAPPFATRSIPRGELIPVLEAGLGRFLQNVQTEPDFEQGTFVGFRILSFFPGRPGYAAVDLGPGDTVTSVNGRPIGRPEQAAEVWESLRAADELVVAYKRGGETRSLKFAIVD